MTHLEIARALGISRTLVQVIERRAIRKLRALMGHSPRRMAHWLEHYDRPAPHRGRYRCGRCGEEGHNARGCVGILPKRGEG